MLILLISLFSTIHLMLILNTYLQVMKSNKFEVLSDDTWLINFMLKQKQDRRKEIISDNGERTKIP